MIRAAQAYAHPGYAASLAEFGRPRRLPRSGGWLLERPIAGTSQLDGLGVYPLFACEDWGGLEADLHDLAGDLVSVALVADPFGGFVVEDLQHWFPDACVPFKPHYLVALGPVRGGADLGTAHHRRKARQAAAAVEVEITTEPAHLLPQWLPLYAHLVQRRALTGLRAFSPTAFARQLAVPGLVAVWAHRHGEPLSMTLWFVAGHVAYYHLGASSAAGYREEASYALFDAAIRHFAAAGLQWLHLGGAPGTRSGADDGLDRFKRGWATTTRTVYFCGRIFDHARYAALSAGQAGAYFPLYRAGEFS